MILFRYYRCFFIIIISLFLDYYIFLYFYIYIFSNYFLFFISIIN